MSGQQNGRKLGAEDVRAYLVVGSPIGGMGLRRRLVRSGQAVGYDVSLVRARERPELSARLRRWRAGVGALLLLGVGWEVIEGPARDVVRLKTLYNRIWRTDKGHSSGVAMVLGGNEEDQLEVERLLDLYRVGRI